MEWRFTGNRLACKIKENVGMIPNILHYSKVADWPIYPMPGHTNHVRRFILLRNNRWFSTIITIKVIQALRVRRLPVSLSLLRTPVSPYRVGMCGVNSKAASHDKDMWRQPDGYLDDWPLFIVSDKNTGIQKRLPNVWKILPQKQTFVLSLMVRKMYQTMPWWYNAALSIFYEMK